MPQHADGHNAPVIVDSEIETLLAFLGYLRDCVARKLDRMSEEQARRAVVASGTSLLGLVSHLSEVESYWMQRRFAGTDVPPDPDAFSVGASDTIEGVMARYRRAASQTDEIARACGDPEQPLARGSQGLTLRWALVHVIEETARHAGHADIARELIDGSVGR